MIGQSYAAITACAFLILTPTLALADWSTWEHFAGNSRAALEVRTNDGAGFTEVQWRLVNNTSETLYIAVKDKEYTVEGGGSARGPNEGSNVRAHDNYTLQPDRVDGHVRAIRATININ